MEIAVQVPVVTGLTDNAGPGLTFRGTVSGHISEAAGNSVLGQGIIMAESGHRLLLVESDPLLAEVTAYRLQLLGYRVEVAETTAELWAGVDSLRPHALLINLDMDDLRPIELLERLTSDTTTADIPLFAFSAQSDLNQVERVWKNGVRDYLVTPYDPIILERKVAKLLTDVALTSESKGAEDSIVASEDEEAADANTVEVSTAELAPAGA